ncbi:CYTH domain-containing protein [Ignicoccus hospitalis]|uniref:CYTH domain-containing protein n=1 Tax=Ignicoccus hospitalis (strain KIN4/I / DSM 18386 / JCM 14125) TaxID=453591 RepID=A8AA92_IGNH4|nr:CYTH domain-containing protein [Ignicoccus hospitalis]ABU81844.1 hypothetical protein Igni_0662 [Ignicoccus hospitalis KIN4/I]HIH90112.1 CYTH domain-containing protein [Desulfurococcaceae archaeon]
MKPYEAEARFFVHEGFKETLERMGFKVVYEYKFVDHFYCPPGGWREEGKTLRARDWGGRCEVLFTRVEKLKFGDLEFKRSLYPQGKVKLYEGSLEECVKLLEDMEFVKCGEVRKEEGYIMSNGDVEVALEKINGKWVLEVEVEGADPNSAYLKMKEIMKLLGLKSPTSKSTFELFSNTNTTGPS